MMWKSHVTGQFLRITMSRKCSSFATAIISLRNPFNEQEEYF